MLFVCCYGWYDLRCLCLLSVVGGDCCCCLVVRYVLLVLLRLLFLLLYVAVCCLLLFGAGCVASFVGCRCVFLFMLVVWCVVCWRCFVMLSGVDGYGCVLLLVAVSVCWYLLSYVFSVCWRRCSL